MANMIDRDPEQILAYAQHINQMIDNIQSKLRQVEDLPQYLSDLNDKNCQVLFKDLSLSCGKFYKALDQLKTENDDIALSAKRLKLTVDEGMGGYSL